MPGGLRHSGAAGWRRAARAGCLEMKKRSFVAVTMTHLKRQPSYNDRRPSITGFVGTRLAAGLQTFRGVRALSNHSRTHRLRAVVPGLAVVALGCWPAGTRAQVQAAVAALPDAPGVSSSAIAGSEGAIVPSGSASIAGTVVDTGGDVVQGARVALVGPGGEQVLESGADGQFSFANLPAGTFRLTVTAPSMCTFESAVAVAAGETRFLPKIVLAFTAGVTEVHVTANEEQIAAQEVDLEESQRVLGIVPNFYSAYDWNAPPLDARQKFALAFRSEIDPITLAGAAALAGAEEYQGIYPGYGTGFSGFGKRFAAQYANDFDSRMIGSALLPSLFHQDPRYFYKGTGTIRSRTWYAIRSAFICRGDNGHDEFDFSHVAGDFAAGTLANLYYPEQNEGVRLVVTNGLIEMGGMAGTNLIREFLLPAFTTHASEHRGAAFPRLASHIPLHKR